MSDAPPAPSGDLPSGRPRRLLVVRLSAMGDIIHALPIAENARRAGVEVGWVAETPYGALLQGNPAVSRLFLADTRAWRRSPLSKASRAGIRRLRSELLDFSPDATIDVQGLWKSAVVARLARAPVVSLGMRDRREHTSSMLVDTPVRLDPAVSHVVDQNLALLGPLGIPVVDPAPDARYLLRFPRPAAESFCDGIGSAFALLHPGASRAEKSWGEDQFAALARGLAARAGLSTAISWGPGDEERAARLAELVPEARRIPALDFAGLAHVMARSAVFVAGDTGPVHLADALGVPTVALFSPGARRNVPTRNRPYRGAWLRYDPGTDLETVVTKAIEAAALTAL
ncbi:MAG TPA: glycosyltransferase family 9 protein [Thermoanaerobaculia bacterium]|nr:glycosyltransferase family 9 protein [Thermoanaerobaculia bacterium]